MIVFFEGCIGLCIVKWDIINFYEFLVFWIYNVEGDSIVEEIFLLYEDCFFDILLLIYFLDGLIVLSVIEGDFIDNVDFIYIFKIFINGEIELIVGNVLIWINFVNVW